jgi:hypothetical protein
MDIGHEDQGAVAMSISAYALSGFDEPHDLIMGQMFLCTEIFVGDSLGSRWRGLFNFDRRSSITWLTARIPVFSIAYNFLIFA